MCMQGRNRIGSPYTKSIIQITHLGKQERVTVMVAHWKWKAMRLSDMTVSNKLLLLLTDMARFLCYISAGSTQHWISWCFLHSTSPTAAVAGRLQPGLGQLSSLHRTRNRRWEPRRWGSRSMELLSHDGRKKIKGHKLHMWGKIHFICSRKTKDKTKRLLHRRKLCQIAFPESKAKNRKTRWGFPWE